MSAIKDLTNKRKNDLIDLVNEIYNMFYEKVIEEIETCYNKPKVKKKLKTYLYKLYEILEFDLMLEGEELEFYCNFVKAIYCLVLNKVNEYKLD